VLLAIGHLLLVAGMGDVADVSRSFGEQVPRVHAGYFEGQHRSPLTVLFSQAMMVTRFDV
jgi:hypothetical protein